MRSADVVVIGAGFGGLGTALRLAELGADVILCETLRYPGGCASTFKRQGYEFEAGATLFSGLGEGQLFAEWNRKWNLGLRFDTLDPIVELRVDRWSLSIPPDPHELERRMASLPSVDAAPLGRFFHTQREVADALWRLFDDPSLLPPLSATTVLRHLRRTPSYAPVLRWIGRSLGDVVAHHELSDCEPLRIYLDAVSQITVQANANQAEAPFAMAAADYFFRGTGHVHGGIGALASALVDAIRQAGGRVELANRVQSLRREDGAWVVRARKGEIRCSAVAANVLPQSLSQMITPRIDDVLPEVRRNVEEGWGAAMLYLAVDASATDHQSAHHLQLVDDTERPFAEGNHLFCSISSAEESGRAPPGQRTVTVSTHVPMKTLHGLSETDQGQYIGEIQNRMRKTLGNRAPRLLEAARFQMTASPRTFERFTGRYRGYVGGVPRRVGLQHYLPRALWPRQAQRGLYLVGDSVLLGQSTLAVALGGVRTAERIARRDT
ncbi:MAG: FAD-dependent oxidoreductase [Myxococcales bacterium SG8_38]|nr:MAG: FAD-dependent oxidoreductase [Myxococcales bacterium SG8_38]